MKRSLSAATAAMAVAGGVALNMPPPSTPPVERLHAATDSSTTPATPNIVTVMIDDMGWNDVGWHDDNFHTPTMNSLADAGITLERFYTAPTCTPSRSQFMTGRYNIRMGMQDSVIHSTEPRGVPLTEKFLSTKLQQSGYKTVSIGKWHMGMHQSTYLPLQRGFDYHYGIYTGGGSHTGHFSVSQSFTVRHQEEANIWQGYNLWENGVVSQDNFGTTHSTHLYSGKAVEYLEKLEDEDDSQPFFLYLAYQAIHDPITVGDEKYITQTSCNDIVAPPGKDTSGIDWDNRKILCGMVAEIDDGVKNLVLKLKELDEWDDTFMLVFSDNGGVGVHGSKNLPLRGEKADYWEGGVRVPGFVSGGVVESRMALNNVSPYKSSDMVHISDLHTTILQVAGYSPAQEDEEKPLDGVSHFNSWVAGGSTVEGVEAARSELLVNINSAIFGGSGALHLGDYKLIVNPEPSESKIYAKTRKALAAKEGVLEPEEFQNILTYVHAEVLGSAKKYLFNIRKNQFEQDDVAGGCEDDEACTNLYGNPEYAEIQARLENVWAKFQLESAPTTFMWADDGPLANPELFGGMWDAWRDGDNTPKAQYFGMGTLSSAQFDGITNALGGSMGVKDTATSLASSIGNMGANVMKASSAGASSVGMMAVAFAVFGGAVGLLAFRAGRRNAYSELL